MSPPQLDGVVLLRGYDMEIALLELFPSLVLLCDAFEDDVGLLRFVESYHVHFYPVLEGDHLREEGLADFTLEFGEVVGHCDPVQLSLHLAVYPVLQAPRMH
jgi:hypothetical protein